MYVFGGTYSKGNHDEGVFITKNGLLAPSRINPGARGSLSQAEVGIYHRL